ncbi:MAG: hypothetical protein RLZZ273_762 [Bacteroidota bacterium]
MRTRHIILGLVLVLCSVMIGHAQESNVDSTAVVEIEKNDRSTIVGRIISIDAREVVISTSSGRIYVPKHEIRRIGSSGGAAAHTIPFDDLGAAPFGSYYGFTQGALPHERDQGHLQITPFSTNFELYLSERLSVGLLASVIAAPIIGRANYTFSSSGDFHVSGGGFVGWGGSVAPNGGIVMPLVSITKGDSRNNVSISAGYGYLTFLNDVLRFDGENRRVDPYTGQVWVDTLSSRVDTRLNTARAWLSVGIVTEISSTMSFVLDGFFISDAGRTKLPTNATYLSFGEDFFSSYRVITDVETYSTIIISPSLRWRYSPRAAFQFGFTGYKGNFLNLEGNSNWSSFPIPMVQWMFKL